MDDIEEEKSTNKEQAGVWRGGRDPLKDDAASPPTTTRDRPMVRSVMFVPFTWDGILVKRLRQSEEKMSPFTNWRIKFVERAGVKVQDMLHTSNPWQGADCGREKCLLAS